MSDLFNALAFFVTFPGIAVSAALLLIGYAARKYAEKRWPNEAAMADALVKRYGEQAEDRARAAIAAVQDSLAKR